MKTKIQELNQKIQRHKKRRMRHNKTLMNPKLPEWKRRRAIEGVEIQTAIINKLKNLKQLENCSRKQP